MVVRRLGAARRDKVDAEHHTFFDGDSLEPRDEVKGAFARAVFYMATRYEGSESEGDLELVDASGTNGDAGELAGLPKGQGSSSPQA